MDIEQNPIMEHSQKELAGQKDCRSDRRKTVLRHVSCFFQQGNNLHIGKNFFCNRNCQFLDRAQIYIGDNVLLAPNVSILTISHPLLAEQRIVRKFKDSFEPQKRGNYELIAPVTIGNNVWIATGSIICPGVTIGDNAVIGAGSVVTSDIPPNVLAFGSPAKVIREITEEDRFPINEYKE